MPVWICYLIFSSVFSISKNILFYIYTGAIIIFLMTTNSLYTLFNLYFFFFFSFCFVQVHDVVVDHSFSGKFHKSWQRFVCASLHQDLGRRLLFQQVGLVAEAATLDEQSENSTLFVITGKIMFLDYYCSSHYCRPNTENRINRKLGNQKLTIRPKMEKTSWPKK